MKTVKGMLATSPDVNLALLSYRATPLPWCGLSAAELLMDQVIRTDVPQGVSKYKPEWLYVTQFAKTRHNRAFFEIHIFTPCCSV